MQKITSLKFQKNKCDSLDQAREQIDALDQVLIELISIRQFYVDQAVRFKRTETEVQSPERVEQVIGKVRKKAEELGTDPDLVETIYREMIQHFIQRELKEIRP
ncbi:chorismate mutase [Acinetobacter stercoris]|uniref:chorismate mutase n=1 Tax=Acinetobacter stercoris TaxID=2126983 RepID=A0A2U3MX79_9GAMM|nr:MULTISPECIES: chorismate mutase [Acinetobacter]SPL70036.1 Salicylate biosynthesis protein PchB [Acinetobacter stercoris]